MGASEVEARTGAAWLQQGSRGQNDGQPEDHAAEQGDQQAERSTADGLRGRSYRAIHVGSLSLLAVVQVTWVGLIGYGVYWVGHLLP